jgi:S-adenosylmethionine:tRNA ribosyltransferase-isomerase
VLESIADEKGFIKSCKGETNIFIYPPISYRCVQSLIKNFHLPKSSLIMLVSAFAGKEEILRLYETAVKEKTDFSASATQCSYYRAEKSCYLRKRKRRLFSSEIRGRFFKKTGF